MAFPGQLIQPCTVGMLSSVRGRRFDVVGTRPLRTDSALFLQIVNRRITRSNLTDRN